MTHIRSIRTAALLFAALAALSAPAAAQEPAPLVKDLLADISDVEGKLVALAEDMTAAQYDWRPGEGVRSVGEVFKHVASDNYYLAEPFGGPAPEDTGIKLSDYATTGAYEHRMMTKEQTIAELKRSFAHLKGALSKVGTGDVDGTLSAFGQSMSRRALLISTTTHLHEHLGQAIAYARMNGVVPRWSR